MRGLVLEQFFVIDNEDKVCARNLAVKSHADLEGNVDRSREGAKLA